MWRYNDNNLFKQLGSSPSAGTPTGGAGPLKEYDDVSYIMIQVSLSAFISDNLFHVYVTIIFLLGTWWNFNREVMGADGDVPWVCSNLHLHCYHQHIVS